MIVLDEPPAAPDGTIADQSPAAQRIGKQLLGEGAALVVGHGRHADRVPGFGVDLGHERAHRRLIAIVVRDECAAVRWLERERMGLEGALDAEPSEVIAEIGHAGAEGVGVAVADGGIGAIRANQHIAVGQISGA